MATSSSRVTVWPVSAAAAMMPATTHVELEPSPRATGTSVSMPMETGKASSPHSRSASTNDTYTRLSSFWNSSGQPEISSASDRSKVKCE